MTKNYFKKNALTRCDMAFTTDSRTEDDHSVALPSETKEIKNLEL